MTTPAPYVYTPGLPTVILCDLDGTAALITDRRPYEGAKCGQDTPCPEVRTVLQALPYNPVYLSGRDDTHAEITGDWLTQHGFPWGALFMRPAGDPRPDEQVKLELFNTHIRGIYNVFVVLDDRDKVVKMWRSLGLKVFQVAEGNF